MGGYDWLALRMRFGFISVFAMFFIFGGCMILSEAFNFGRPSSSAEATVVSVQPVYDRSDSEYDYGLVMTFVDDKGQNHRIIDTNYTHNEQTAKDRVGTTETIYYDTDDPERGFKFDRPHDGMILPGILVLMIGLSVAAFAFHMSRHPFGYANMNSDVDV